MALNSKQSFITRSPVLPRLGLRDAMQGLGQGGLSGAAVTGAKPYVQKDLLPKGK